MGRRADSLPEGNFTPAAIFARLCNGGESGANAVLSKFVRAAADSVADFVQGAAVSTDANRVVP